MRENKSPLTVSQALKVYTGTGLAGTILGLAMYECVFFVGAYAAMALVIALSDGTSFTEAISNIAETPAGDCMVAIAPALINCLILLVPYDRNAPGGKLFRTFRGGFYTFARSRIGIYASAVLATMLFCVFALVLDLIGLTKVQYSGCAEAAALIATLAALGAGTLALLIPNDAARAFISVIICFAVTAGGALALSIFSILKDSIIPYIIAGVGGAALLAVSVKAYLSYYKKNLWDD